MMKTYRKIILNCTMLAAALGFFSCEKEHLQPDIPSGASSEPIVYISARMDNDSIHYQGGVDYYAGETAVIDTLNWRYFTFFLYCEQSTPAHPRPYFKICINNSQQALGPPAQDLESTIVPGLDTLPYQNYWNQFVAHAVTVEWFDSTGNEYSSSFFPQYPINYNFIVTSVENVSFQNKAYKKVTAEFNCVLSDINSTNFVSMSNGRATLLFGAD